MALNKKNRLKKKKDFETVFKKGKAVKGNFLFVKYFGNNLGLPRIAFVVSLKVSKKAVIRNRIRRTISEIVSKSLKKIQPVDIIIIADRKILGASRDEIIHETETIIKNIR